MPHPHYQAVADRADGLCEYRKTPERLAGYGFEVEHITPRARGGADTLENLAPACGPCNKAKATRQRARDTVTGALVPLFDPRGHTWSEHFTWSDDYTVIVGRTPVGHATVASLRLNTTRRRDARVLWRAVASLGLGQPPFQWP
jgi:hypothetical protein